MDELYARQGHCQCRYFTIHEIVKFHMQIVDYSVDRLGPGGGLAWKRIITG
jgi:hypothetical protein